MIRLSVVVVMIVLVVAGCGSDDGSSTGTGRTAPAGAEDAAIARLEENIRERVDAGRAPAIVAGVLLADGSTRVIAYGDVGGGRRPDEDTVFEIGSITKTFTATVLADMARAGELGLEDPVGGLLPGWSIPSRGRAIRLVDLATQTSGLPREPSNLRPENELNPWADYGPAELRTFLATHRLRRTPGRTYEYSNVGFGLLGVALSSRAGVSFDRLVRDRILRPLKMDSTGLAVTPAMRERLAIGRGEAGTPVPPVAFDAIAGAGALRSTTADMLRYAAANLASGAPLSRSMADAQKPRHAAVAGMRIGLAWHVAEGAGGAITWHNGGTIGFRSILGLDRARGRAVVIWTNSTGEVTDDLGFNFLDPRAPLAPAPITRTAIDLPNRVLDRYVGEYQLPGLKVTITRGPNGLIASPEGQSPAPLFAESETEFFLRAIDAQVTFQVGNDGAATGLILHQAGADTPATKTG